MLRQSTEDWQLIVVDDGSTDGTADWIRSAYAGQPRMRLIAGVARRGAAAAANAGIDSATGAYLAFLDSDDEWEPAFLASLRAALDAAPEAIAAYCDQIQVWDAVAVERVARAPDPEDQRRGFLVAPPITCLSQVLFRREALRALGPLDTRFTIVSDRDLLMRAALRGQRPFTHLPMPLARRHFHSGNLANQAELARAEGQAAIERAFAHPAAAPYRPLRDAAISTLESRLAAYAGQRATLATVPALPISVVIATRNRRTLLAAAIASVDRQSYANRELIVVDDSSTDDTRAWLAGLGRPDIRVLHAQAGMMSKTRNLGNAAACGDVIAGLDDDDAWMPDYLASVAAAFALEPRPIFTFADYLSCREPGGALTRVVHESPGQHTSLVERMLHATFPLSTTVFAVSRSVFHAVGGYDESSQRAEDFDLYLRLLTHRLRPPFDAQTTHTPAHIARPLAIRLLAPVGRDPRALFERSLADNHAVLDKFFASEAGAPYRDLRAAARLHWRHQLARYYRHTMGVDVAGPAGDHAPPAHAFLEKRP